MKTTENSINMVQFIFLFILSLISIRYRMDFITYAI